MKITDIDFEEERALIRVDFNVPLNDKLEVTDDTRIRRSLPTINYILANGGAVVLMSHLGRPKNGPEDQFSLRHLVGPLADILNSGKALYVGISNYSAEDTLKAEEILNSKGRHCLIHQPKYNMFERWIENGLTNVLREKGIGSIPFSPLAQGLLTDKYLDGIPQNSRASKPHGFLKPEHLTEEKISKVKKLNEIAINRGQKLSQLALNWILRLDEVTSALIGASSIKQIEEAVESINAPKLTADELTNIENILSE